MQLRAARGRRAGGEHAARATAWIAALHPPLAGAGGQVRRESLAVALFAPSLAALCSGTGRDAVVTGALLALAAANQVDMRRFRLPALAHAL